MRIASTGSANEVHQLDLGRQILAPDIQAIRTTASSDDEIQSFQFEVSPSLAEVQTIIVSAPQGTTVSGTFSLGLTLV